MAKDGASFDQWLERAKLPPRLRTARHLAVLQAAFAFFEQTGGDYASQRMLAHFLLTCQLGLKLAQIACLVGVTRPTASRQSRISSRQVVREIQHRLAGRAYGKLLPRYAGPIVHFLVTQPDATRADLLDFIERTWDFRVSHKGALTFSLDHSASFARTRTDERTAQTLFCAVFEEPDRWGPTSPR